LVAHEGLAAEPETYLSDEFVRQLTAVGQVDVLVGVPTFNNRDTIERVLSAIQVGLVKYFPRERSVLISPDGGSTDGTPELVNGASIKDFRTLLTPNPLRTMHRIIAPYHGIHGKESALRIIFAAADLLRAKACALVSPDLQAITPEWIESLVRPIYRENFDLVTPIYHRHKFDGLLVKNVLAPVFRAVYGSRVQEPLGGEFGISGRLACHCLAQDVWRRSPSQMGIDLWMSATAVVDGFRLCQSFLGPKIHASRRYTQDLVGTIQQVVGSLFQLLETHQNYWLSAPESKAVPVFGFEYSVALEPMRINRKQLLQSFRTGVAELVSVLETILSPETLREMQSIAQLGDREFRFPNELWAKTIYEFADSYHRSVIDRQHLLQALTPLYRGRSCSFVLENERSRVGEIERRLEELGRDFERLKPYLAERWSRTK
jgi:hypothetical protein